MAFVVAIAASSHLHGAVIVVLPGDETCTKTVGKLASGTRKSKRKSRQSTHM